MRLACLVAATLALTSGYCQEVERKVDGILILSSDNSLPQRLQKAFQIGTPFVQFAKSFASNSVIVEPWGKRSAILIDRRIGPISTRVRKTEALKLLAKHVTPDLILDLGTLSEEDRSNVLSCMGGVMIDPSVSGRPGLLGVEVSTSFVIDDPARPRMESRLPMRGPITDKRKQALIGSPFAEWRPRSRAGVDRKLESILQEEIAASGFRVYTMGLAKNYVADGLVQSGKLLEILLKQLDASQESAAKELAGKLGSTNGLPESLGGIASAPESIQKRLEDTFAKSFRANGFESEAQALAYLRQASNLRVSTNLSLMYCVSPGGAGNAPTFAVYQIATFAGTLPP